MNTKKFTIAFIVIFVLFEATNYLIHGVLLSSTYKSDKLTAVFRSEEAMMSNMWIIWLTDLVWSFFFVFFFVKGYENKGIMEGLRFGFYMGLFFALFGAYQSYAVFPVTYSLTFQWFIYGMIQTLLFGVVAALIYKPKEAAEMQAATV